MRDVTVIGAGVTGSCIARELSRYELDILVLEKGSDVCEGTSKANSGIAHSGYDAKPGTLKARFNVEGNRLIHVLSRELDFPFKENGSLVLALDEEGRSGIRGSPGRWIRQNPLRSRGGRTSRRCRLLPVRPRVFSRCQWRLKCGS